MGTSAVQEAAHKAAVALSEGTRQAAIGAAKAAFDGAPANYPTSRPQ
jgi:hypothetical protein